MINLLNTKLTELKEIWTCVMTLSIMLVLEIGIHNVFASDIASLIPTGNENMTRTPPSPPSPHHHLHQRQPLLSPLTIL
jgi:hypothetical protein